MREKENQEYKTGLEIAVIGMAARFPGARDIDEFWDNLINGKETLTTYTDEELKEAGIDAETLKNPAYVKSYGWLADIEFFDYSFFGYTPLEAELMDPQVCILHECAIQALENAGYDCYTCTDLIGLYTGASHNFDWQARAELSGKNNILGRFASLQLNDKDFLATRIAHRLSLKGPAVTLDTACSTSLVAIHLACQGLLSGDCDMALAGGVSIPMLGKRGYLYQEGMLNSPDGHCRAFDEKAKGCNFGNGVGLVVLKRLEEAVADGDTIHAVIKGSSINNDGDRKSGYTAPSIEGQAEVIRSAHEMSEVHPESIGYVETHGTGTPLGDPVEIEGLKTAFNSDKRHFCPVGSVKTNIGHLEIAAGIAGFIKTVLVLKNKLIPPSLYFKTPNPKIDFENSPFLVNTELTQWKQDIYPRRAGVSSFGIGGTNAHVVLEEVSEGTRELAPLSEEEVLYLDRAGGSSFSREYQLILLSAKTQSTLDKMSQNLAEYFKNNLLNRGNQESPDYPGRTLADAAYTLQVGRPVHQFRRMLVCKDVSEAVQLLSAPDSGKVKTVHSREDNRPIVFMFSGLGSQYVNMGRDLYEKEPLFRHEMDRCFEILETLVDYDSKEILYPGLMSDRSDRSDRSDINQPEIAQIMIFIFEYSLVQLLMSWGIHPHAMIGYSFGEYTAACAAGVFSLEDALNLVVARGRLIQQAPEGAMLSVPLSREAITPNLNREVSLAIDNGPSCIVSGPVEAVNAFEKQMKDNRLVCMRVPVDRALHSPAMTPILQEFAAILDTIQFNQPQIPYISNVNGDWVQKEEVVLPRYWTTHLISTVRFADGMKVLLEDPNIIFVEIGPGRDISTLTQRHIEDSGNQGCLMLNLVKPSHQEKADDYLLLNRLGMLWLHGQSIDWPGFYGEEKRQRIPLPAYPFEGQRCWIDANAVNMKEHVQRLSSDIHGHQSQDMADWFYIPSWKRSHKPQENAEEMPGDFSWMVFIDDCGLGSLLVEQLEKEAPQVVTVKSGERFLQESDTQFIINPQKEEDYDNIFTGLRHLEMKTTKIVHLWCITTGEGDSLSPGTRARKPHRERAGRIQDLGFYSLLNIVRSIGKLGFEEEIQLTVVTNHMQEVSGGDGFYPEKATVLGPVQVIPKEYTNIKCRSIDVAFPPSPLVARVREEKRLIRQLRDELLSKSTESVLAYRSQYRWVQSFEPFRCQEAGKKPARLRPSGVYLITGGLGGIGLILAEYLARTVGARLVLVSRTGLPPRDQWEPYLVEPGKDKILEGKIRKIKELEDSGADVLLFSADVSDLKQMKKVITRVEEQVGPINGIIHCAGLADGEMIQRRTPGTSIRILKPKVQGTLVLNSLLPLMKGTPDFFILFSSISSIVPALGQVSYCAANAFLDAFAHYRSAIDFDADTRKDTMLTLSINWPRWRNIGIATILEKQHKKITGEDMEGGMSDEECLEAFSRILEKQEPQVVVTNHDLMALISKSKEANAAYFTKGGKGITSSKSHNQRPNLDSDYIPPGNDTETVLVNIWSGFFGFDRVGIQDDFFELGGDSLKALLLLPKIHKELQVEIPIVEFFNRTTIQKLSDYIRGVDQAAYYSIEAVEKKDYYALSSGQKRLYILQQMQKDGIAYNESQVVSQEFDPGRDTLEKTYKKLIRRHESLRTSFQMIADKPVQRIHDEVEFEIEYFDLSGTPTARRRQLIISTIKNFIRPFDLSRAPLLRVGLIKENQKKYIVMVDLHHIITDGTSNGILLQEFTRLHQGNELPPLNLQYKDYAEWFNSEERRSERVKQETYWLKALAGELPVLNLPTDYSRPGEQSYLGSNFGFRIGKDETRALKNLLSSQTTTLYMKLLAIFNVFLFKLTGQEDIIVGSPTLGRRHWELEHIIGMFVNSLPIRNYPRAEKTFSQLLKEVKENSLRGFENQEYAFEDLIDKLNVPRDVSRNPVFDVFFDLQNQQTGERDGDGQQKLLPYGYRYGISKFDLTLHATEYDEGIAFRIEYCIKLFSDETIKRFAGIIKKIISSLIIQPHRKLWEIDILSEEEKNQLLDDFNNTRAAYSKDKPLHRLFEEQVEKVPDHIALVGKEEGWKGGRMDGKKEEMNLSYRELHERSGQLAGFLIEKGVQADTIVGIMVERSLVMIVGLLGILKAGGAYLPIDPAFPPERISYMLKNSSAEILLTTPGLSKEIKYNNRVIHVTDAINRFPGSPHLHLSPRPVTCFAYILYTSGSTGNPKGVAVTHQNVVNFIAGMTEVIDFLPGKVILALTTMSFDIFFLETLLPVTCGLKVVIADENQQKKPALLQKIIIKHDLNMIQVTPSRLKLLMDFADGRLGFDSIRDILVGGEAFPASIFKRLKEVFPGKIYNVYGPTETTIWSTVKDLSRCAPEELNIGRPILNTQVYIVSRFYQLQPLGVMGELLIGGDGVARGYLNNPQLTAEKFILAHSSWLTADRTVKEETADFPMSYQLSAISYIYKTGDLARWLPPGEIEFLGRVDHQVKIRGYRIELKEIEEQLLIHENIKEAVVKVSTNKMGDKCLCAYFVPMSAGITGAPNGIDVSRLREMLAAKLPDYMVPSYFVPLEKIPLTPNGKADQKALPKPGGAVIAAKTFVAPGTSNEKILANIWKEVLQIETVGIYDNFFNMGGNSLNVIRLNQKLLEVFGKEIPVTEMFKNLTIHFLDQFLGEDKRKDEERKYEEDIKQSEIFDKAKRTYKQTINKFRK
ncbi:MAG: amino acid adenylation domain-containing protein [Candidatus Aminicenantes bacterium]|jgi:amino acid adenylation domain-containing protein